MGYDFCRLILVQEMRGLEELGGVSKDVLHGFFPWYCGSHVSLIGTQVHREGG
jgi:hypothetical protein